MGWLTALLTAAALVAGATPAPLTPVAAHSMLYLDSPPALKRSMLDGAAGLGVSLVRADVGLSTVITGPDARDWGPLDETVRLARERRLRLLGVLLAPPASITDCPADVPADQRFVCPVADQAAFGRDVMEVVRRAGPTVVAWEVLNEPDQAWAYRGTPQQYAATLRTAAAAIRAANPDARVVFGGVTTGAENWVRAVLAEPGTAAAYDVAAVHVRGRIGALAPTVRRFKGLFAAAGHPGPLWVTEHGYPADPAFQRDPAFRGGAPSQAAYLARSIPELLAGGADVVAVSERDNLHDAAASEGVLAGPVGDPAVTPRPAAQVVRDLARTLRG